MIFRSIRARLALSFAAIALVAALVLGAVLLVILQGIYSGLELGFLRGNAKFVSSFVATMTLEQAPHEEVQSQIENLAFLSQSRIQVYDNNRQLVYDSGSPRQIDVNLGVGKQWLAPQDGKPNGQVMIRIIGVEPKPGVKTSKLDSSLDANNIFIYRSVQAAGTPFGFDLNADDRSTDIRSSQVAQQLFLDKQTGKTLGTVELSEGPAYGRDVLTSVAKGWALASIVAVLLAAVAGWFVSRQMTAPLFKLADATERMAGGDLASRAIVNSRDEYGQLARSFNEMADQVQVTVGSLRQFVSDAAHELHTPLTALRTNLDLATRSDDPSPYIERSRDQVQRLETLANDLLDLSRIEAKDIQDSAQLVDLGRLVRESAEVYASQVDQADLTLTLAVPESPVRVRGDSARLRRVLSNLLDNACKFTPPGRSVSIQLMQEHTQVTLSITDTGIGIPPEDLPGLFRRFFRARNASSYPGNGLGLAIVRAIVERQHGTICAENLPGGTRFTVHWPPAIAR